MATSIHQAARHLTAQLFVCALMLSGCDQPVAAPPATSSQPVSSEVVQSEVVPSEKVLPATVAPEAVLEKFYMSLANSEKEGALACTTGDALTEGFIDSQIRLNAAFALFGRNALKKFPEEGMSMQMPSPALIAAKKVSEVPVIVAGSNATWPSNPASPLRLVLIEGQWKIDLASSFPSPEVVQQANTTFDSVSALISDIASEIAAGKFENAAMVRQELKRRREADKL